MPSSMQLGTQNPEALQLSDLHYISTYIYICMYVYMRISKFVHAYTQK